MYGSSPIRSTRTRASRSPPKKPITIANPRPAPNSSSDDSSAVGSVPLLVMPHSAEHVAVNVAKDDACV